MKTCEFCKKKYTTKNMARHLRTCKKKKDEYYILLRDHLNLLNKFQNLEKENRKLEKKNLNLEIQLLKKNTKVTNNNYNIVLNILSPIGLDPSDPSYIDSIQLLTGNIKRRLKNQTFTEETENLKQVHCQTALNETIFPKEGNPKYLITDASRKKGIYKTSDGKLKHDTGQHKLSQFFKEGAQKADVYDVSLNKKDICEKGHSIYKDNI